MESNCVGDTNKIILHMNSSYKEKAKQDDQSHVFTQTRPVITHTELESKKKFTLISSHYKDPRLNIAPSEITGSSHILRTAAISSGLTSSYAAEREIQSPSRIISPEKAKKLQKTIFAPQSFVMKDGQWIQNFKGVTRMVRFLPNSEQDVNLPSTGNTKSTPDRETVIEITKIASPKDNNPSVSSYDMVQLPNQQFINAVTSRRGPKDDSLTNIQWLGKMQAGTIVETAPSVHKVKDLRDKKLFIAPTMMTAPKVTDLHRDLRVIATEKQIDKISRECGRKKRPPYSYMHLIQMAIGSHPEGRMTLKEIYTWIEDKFPYYKFTTKQGWKNSIRHNLSLYDIFVRQKPDIPGKTGSSHWTLSKDIPVKHAGKRMNSSSTSTDTGTEPTPTTNVQNIQSPVMHVINVPHQTPPVISPPGPASSSRQGADALPIMLKQPRKGPAPLLPKPGPVQAYALIPLAGGMSLVQQQPMVFSSWPNGSTTNKTVTSIAGQVTSLANIAPAPGHSTLQYIGNQSDNQDSPFNLSCGLKRTSSSSAPVRRKIIKIAPKATILGGNRRVCKPLATSSPMTNTDNNSSVDTSDLQHQLSQFRFDSGVEMSDFSSSQEYVSLDQLPNIMRQKVYRHKRPRKERQQIRCDSGEKENVFNNITSGTFSETGIDVNELITNIEKDFTSPMKELLKTPPKPGVSSQEDELMNLSPLGLNFSPKSPLWISPIRGATQENDGLDSGFLTPEGKLSTSTPTRYTRPARKSKPKGLLQSPCSGSLRDLGLPGFTPLKGTYGSSPVQGSPNTSLSNQSFTNLLKGEFQLEDIEEGLGVDINFWSPVK